VDHAEVTQFIDAVSGIVWQNLALQPATLVLQINYCLSAGVPYYTIAALVSVHIQPVIVVAQQQGVWHEVTEELHPGSPVLNHALPSLIVIGLSPERTNIEDIPCADANVRLEIRYEFERDIQA